MRFTLKALAALLAYPSLELQENIPSVRRSLQDDGALSRRDLARLEPLLTELEGRDLLELQVAYSDLFDRSRKFSLHLFEHIHGDNRERGQAMIDLGQQYAGSGLLLDTTELPDFVPVFLEYAAHLPPGEARELLGQPAHVFAVLAERLDERTPPYAAIFHALVALAAGRPDAEALAELQDRAPEEDPANLDREWEEAPVTFLASAAHEMGGPNGVVAKIRASNRSTEVERGK